MRAALLLCLGLLAACGADLQGIRPTPSGGDRGDGYVAMSSTGTIGNPVGPDWAEAAAGAGRRCRAWGYAGAGTYAGWREVCRGWDRYGRCVWTIVTRYYPCAA